MMKRKRILAGLTAAVLLAVSGCGSGHLAAETESTEDGGYELAKAVYPEMAPYPDEAAFTDEKTGEWNQEKYLEAYDAWWKEKRALADLPEADGKDIAGFSKNSIRRFLLKNEGENKVYSPVNTYMALAMLAEVTDGESRQQILDLLEAGDLKTLRAHGENIWRLCYSDDGAVTSIPANSLWLRDGMEYNQNTLDLLAQHYYASSYRGEMGSEEYDRALQTWLNEQTGGLLKEQAEGMKMSPETVMALASTLYYRAKWQNEFREEDTKEGYFYGPEGEIRCDFMNSSNFSNYYWAEDFAAVSLGLNESGRMWLVLPDEGVTVDEILEEDAVFELVNSRGEWENSKYLKVNLSLPKFDVASDISLTDGLKELGVQDVFDPQTADFSPLAQPADGFYLSQAQHAARVKIDEKGVEAAAYTVMQVSGAAMPPEEEVDFVLDRPFFFLITSRTGLPLFAGIVNQPG